MNLKIKRIIAGSLDIIFKIGLISLLSSLAYIFLPILKQFSFPSEINFSIQTDTITGIGFSTHPYIIYLTILTIFVIPVLTAWMYITNSDISKRIFGLDVIDENGHKLSFIKITIREIIKSIVYLTFLGTIWIPLDIILVIVTGKTSIDWILSTQVVKSNQ
jgi:uncharacterized RDD family membrane protein YckC